MDRGSSRPTRQESAHVKDKACMHCASTFLPYLYTVEPLTSKGHFRTSNFCPQLSLVGRFPLLMQRLNSVVWSKKSCMSLIQRFLMYCVLNMGSPLSEVSLTWIIH